MTEKVTLYDVDGEPMTYTDIAYELSQGKAQLSFLIGEWTQFQRLLGESDDSRMCDANPYGHLEARVTQQYLNNVDAPRDRCGDHLAHIACRLGTEEKSLLQGAWDSFKTDCKRSYRTYNKPRGIVWSRAECLAKVAELTSDLTNYANDGTDLNVDDAKTGLQVMRWIKGVNGILADIDTVAKIAMQDPDRDRFKEPCRDYYPDWIDEAIIRLETVVGTA